MQVEEIAAAVSHKKAQGPEDPLETFCKVSKSSYSLPTACRAPSCCLRLRG